MSSANTPRSVVKALVRGEAPTRPLLMPLMFSLGARLENLPLREFQSKPTRITNALKQIRSVLKVDGLTCYFDPFLEVEALGCTGTRDQDGSYSFAPTSFSDVDSLRKKFTPPESLSDAGRIPVACDVVRRLKMMLRDEPALMVVINGPLALAAQLSEAELQPDPTQAMTLTGFSAEVTLSVSKTLVDAGADIVVIRERWPSTMSREVFDKWMESIEPIMNLVRFYEALPVLLLGGTGLSSESSGLLANRLDNCVLIPGLAVTAAAELRSKKRLSGLALPTSVFAGEQPNGADSLKAFEHPVPDETLAVVTTFEDIPGTADLKQVARTLEVLRNRLAN